MSVAGSKAFCNQVLLQLLLFFRANPYRTSVRDFRKPPRFRLKKSQQTSVLCSKLPNFILENSAIVNVTEQSGMDSELRNEPYDSTAHLQDTCDIQVEQLIRQWDSESSNMGDDLTDSIDAQGLRRTIV